MQELISMGPVRGYGPTNVVCRARFSPANTAAAQTLTDNYGIRQVIRASGGQAGRWTVTLAEKFAEFDVFVEYVEDDTTNYHFLRVESKDYNAGTFVLSHRTVAWASVAGTPPLSDTVDAISILVVGRGSL